MTNDEKDDYWSEDAIARRAALRRKIFHEGEESDGEEEFIEQIEQQQPQVASASLPSESLAPNLEPTQPLSYPSSPKAELHPHSILRHHEPSSQPKSILKPPIRKKSVTFDPSIPPASPDSPDIAPSSVKPHKFGFPLPLASDDDHDWAPKPVPTITEPKPKAKKEDDFAGFKKGFLGPPPKVRTAAEVDQPSSSSPPHPYPTITSEQVLPESSQETLKPKPKKKSLFAQRLAHPEIDASAPATSSSTPATASPRSINLPKMAESKGTLAIKGAVVEKPTTTPVPNPSSSHTAGSVVERNIIQPVASSSSPSKQDPSSGISVTKQTSNDDGDDNNGEDSFAEYSSGSEDEYDLDDALLAREVALEYHRRHAYTSLNRDPGDAPFEEEDDNGGEGSAAGMGAGVMLGLPRISDLQGQDGRPVIVNPTPDDLKRFIRVGRLENGNLVLAPGQEGLSDSEGDDGEEEKEGVDDEAKERRERRLAVKKRREQVRNRLMGLPVEGGGLEPQKNKDNVDESLKAMLPPAIQTEVAERQAAVPTPSAQVDTSAAEAKETPVPKKKVSRFKAARMAGAQ